MKLTINTKDKTIEIHGVVTIEEIATFMGNNDMMHYKLIGGR